MPHEDWYSPENILLALNSFIPPDRLLIGLPDNESFGDKVVALSKLSKVNDDAPVYFFCSEPSSGVASIAQYFICGIYYRNRIYFINPLGETSHKDFFEALIDARIQMAMQQQIDLEFFYSNMVFQQEESLKNCGVIVVELLRSLLTLSQGVLHIRGEERKIEISDGRKVDYKLWDPVAISVDCSRVFVALQQGYEEQIEAWRQQHAKEFNRSVCDRPEQEQFFLCLLDGCEPVATLVQPTDQLPAPSAGSKSQPKRMIDPDVVALKRKCIAALKIYTCCWKLSCFGHHHEARAREVIIYIRMAHSIMQIELILQNQLALMKDGVINSFLLSDSKINYDPRWVHQIKNQPQVGQRSGYLEALNTAVRFLPRPP